MKKFIELTVLVWLIWFYLSAIQTPLTTIPTHHRFKIFRDPQGIPRIVAKDKLSAAFGMGYAYAQDRMWTLNIRKLVLEGRMSQIFGQQALAFDLENRNIDFIGIGRMNEKLLDDETRAWVQNYCDGINTYVSHSKILPIEFYLTWSNWQEWKPEHTLANLAFLSFVLQFDWMYQIARQRLAETVGFNLAWKMMPFGQNNLFREVTIINNEELTELGMFRKYESQKIQDILKEHWMKKTMPIGSIQMPEVQYQTLGSNAWAIGGNHTENGKPLLANDPHLGLLIPSLFYMFEVSIMDENSTDFSHQAFGAMVDGLPAMSIGLNDEFAWGSTASYVDNKDIFHEKVRQNNGTLQYFFMNEWKPFKVRKQEFKVRGGQNFVKQFYHTHRGPVIEHVFLDLHFKYGYPIPTHYRINHTLTIQSAIFVPDPHSLKGLSSILFCKDQQSMAKNASIIAAPNIDSAWIDRHGNFGYRSIGRVPKRTVPEMGAFVKDGTTDLYDMKEFLDYKKLPQLRNPKKGYVSMANNKFAEDSYTQRSSIHELSTGRSYRLHKYITEKIKKGQKFNFDTMIEMQLDDKDEFLSEAFPQVLKALESVKQLWSSPQTQKYYQLFVKWDYHMPKNSVQASIYHVFQHTFQESLLHSTNLSQQQRLAILNHAFFQIYLFNLYEKIGKGQLSEEQKIICLNTENANYTNIHPCIANVALSFKKLPHLLNEIFKTRDISKYQWGTIHKNVFKSIPWSDVPGLKNIWGREVAGSGNSRTLNVGILTHQTKSYNSIAGPIFRFITDMNRTIYSFDTGQSDRPYSSFYDNFLGLDKYVEYKKVNPIKNKQKGWHVFADTL